MRSLRSRLILSHVLPVLIILPLAGVLLIYILETQVVLDDLSAELTRQANLTAEIARDQLGIWQDSQQAQLFVSRFGSHYQSQVMLLNVNGQVLAASTASARNQVGQTLDLPNLATALAGQDSVQVHYSRNLNRDIAEVLVPVIDANQQVVGVIRLTHQLADIQVRFLQMRYLVAGVLVLALLVGLGTGLVLALGLERSLRQVTSAISNVASGGQWAVLPERGPEEIRLLLRAFNTLIEQLRMLEEARRRLLANLVHEVGRPVGALQSAIQALLNGADQEVAFRRELLEGMAAETGRLRPLLENLAELHGRVLGSLELNRRPTSLLAWLPPTVAPWREAAQAKGLQWGIYLPQTLPTVDIDPDRLAQVVGNLLSNAIKYTPAGELVAIAAGVEEKEGVWIRVSDTGPGISPTDQAQIFDPFFRSQPGRRFPQGMGLGLTIARDLVVAHGGRLEVESQEGQGSRFTMWLPVASL
ncbi:MAG: HAMP domain-containing histidine kinase [Anaerolineae bacterium]|nr:HAMP domain-containing histidine kinase [Anaerolineae bacterium]